MHLEVWNRHHQTAWIGLRTERCLSVLTEFRWVDPNPGRKLENGNSMGGCSVSLMHFALRALLLATVAISIKPHSLLLKQRSLILVFILFPAIFRATTEKQRIMLTSLQPTFERYLRPYDDALPRRVAWSKFLVVKNTFYDVDVCHTGKVCAIRRTVSSPALCMQSISVEEPRDATSYVGSIVVQDTNIPHGHDNAVDSSFVSMLASFLNSEEAFSLDLHGINARCDKLIYSTILSREAVFESCLQRLQLHERFVVSSMPRLNCRQILDSTECYVWLCATSLTLPRSWRTFLFSLARACVMDLRHFVGLIFNKLQVCNRHAFMALISNYKPVRHWQIQLVVNAVALELGGCLPLLETAIKRVKVFYPYTKPSTWTMSAYRLHSEEFASATNMLVYRKTTETFTLWRFKQL